MDVASKKKQTQFFGAHAIGIRQHDDEQNERSLGTNLSQLNEKKNSRVEIRIFENCSA